MEISVVIGALISLIIIAFHLRKLMIEGYSATLEEKASKVTGRWFLIDEYDGRIRKAFWYSRYEEWLAKHELHPHTVDYEWWLEMVIDGDIKV